MSQPATDVIDDQKGLQQSILQRFPLAHSQRCLVRAERFVRTCVSGNPKTDAGIELWRPVRSLWDVNTQKDARTWRHWFAFWEAVYAGFIAERSRSIETDSWWYKHRKLRSARLHLQKAFPYLFTIIGEPCVPSTSNHMEGGVNARLKEPVRCHRGLSQERKRVVVAFFLVCKLGHNLT